MNILVFNQKGGVGKTTTALNLAAALARPEGGGTVALVDLDPQCHLSAVLGHRPQPQEWNVSDWLAGRPGLPRPLGERLLLVPGDPEPAEPRPLAASFAAAAETVVIDGPPVWNEAVGAVMAQVDWVLTPLEPDFLGMQGINRLLLTLRRHAIPWERVRLLLCRYDARLNIHREVRERMAQRFRSLLLPVVIRSSVRLAEAHGYGKSIFGYAPGSAGAEDYAELARAVAESARR